jgi:predicted HAD superfamily Cof-like phosphohydrolase
MDVAAAVAEFHQVFGRPMRRHPTAAVDPALARLRVDLVQEEVGEFAAASEQGDLLASPMRWPTSSTSCMARR